MFAVPITGGVVCAHFGLAAGRGAGGCSTRPKPPTATANGSWSNRWKGALNAFDITFDGRISAGRRCSSWIEVDSKINKFSNLATCGASARMRLL